jgi:hypothetical protein
VDPSHDRFVIGSEDSASTNGTAAQDKLLERAAAIAVTDWLTRGQRPVRRCARSARTRWLPIWWERITTGRAHEHAWFDGLEA